MFGIKFTRNICSNPLAPVKAGVEINKILGASLSEDIATLQCDVSYADDRIGALEMESSTDRLDDQDCRLDDLDSRLDGLESNLDDVREASEIGDLENRIDGLENNVVALASHIVALQRRLDLSEIVILPGGEISKITD